MTKTAKFASTDTALEYTVSLEGSHTTIVWAGADAIYSVGLALFGSRPLSDEVPEKDHSLLRAVAWMLYDGDVATAIDVEPSDVVDTEGAVDADVLVLDAGVVTRGDVTLLPNPGLPAGAHGRHPVTAWGGLAHWASGSLVDVLEGADDQPALIREIERVVDLAAQHNDL